MNAAARLRFLLKGTRKRNPASAAPKPPVRRSEAVWFDAVEIERVKLAGAPPVTARLAGAKLHEAWAGRLLHENLMLPEYPAAELIIRA